MKVILRKIIAFLILSTLQEDKLLSEMKTMQGETLMSDIVGEDVVMYLGIVVGGDINGKHHWKTLQGETSRGETLMADVSGRDLHPILALLQRETLIADNAGEGITGRMWMEMTAGLGTVAN